VREAKGKEKAPLSPIQMSDYAIDLHFVRQMLDAVAHSTVRDKPHAPSPKTADHRIKECRRPEFKVGTRPHPVTYIVEIPPRDFLRVLLSVLTLRSGACHRRAWQHRSQSFLQLTPSKRIELHQVDISK